MFDPCLKFKDEKIMHNFCDVRIHPILTDIINYILQLHGEVIVTSAFRPIKIHQTDSGIHSTDPLRALDIRHYIYNNPDALVDIVNRKFTYDPKRPTKKCAIFHNTKGWHIHLQCHDKTRQN